MNCIIQNIMHPLIYLIYVCDHYIIGTILPASGTDENETIPKIELTVLSQQI